MKKHGENAMAFSSITDSGHMPLLDFDRPFRPKEARKLKSYTDSRHLGLIRIIRTGHGFHAYFISAIVPFGRYLKIMRDLKADRKFISYVRKRKYGSLRVSGKDLSVFGYIGRWKRPTPQGLVLDGFLTHFIPQNQANYWGEHHAEKR